MKDAFTGIISWEKEVEHAKRVKEFVDNSLVTYKLSDEELEKYRNMKTSTERVPALIGVNSMRRKTRKEMGK
ncbi:hypothetical protein SAMN02744040_00653 [Tepidibacter thalassicus DSM 15285]|uniref:Uncharacterized protein n=2 Tax=Tepidibacter TaxID=214904 RepID=A0A1M5PXC8_9FIRM|nr:hypothetical protein SAMN02744040_00653 [Tepidibacter thalassicus DSM 15285]